MRYLIILLSLMFSGCAWFETTSGKARYEIAPIILKQADGSEVAACCKLTIFNSKDVGAVTAHGEYDPSTGKILFDLTQEMINATDPTKAGVEGQKAAAEAVTETIRVIPKLP